MPHAVASIPDRETTGATGLEGVRLTGWQHAAAFLIAALVIVSHRPDAVLNPQLWAEDGTLFYAQAHNLGPWKTLLAPVAGYFCLLPRLAAAVAQMLPLAAAPVLFNLIAIFLNAAPASFLLSSRCASLGPVPVRLLLAFLYLSLPNSRELSANITNVHSYLALLVLLVIIAAPGDSTEWRCADVSVVLLGSLTGPFVIMLWPLAAAIWGWMRRTRWSVALLAAMTGCAVVQGLTLLRFGSAARVPGPLGASPLLLAKIVAAQVFAGAIVGNNALPYRHSYEVYAVLIALTGALVWAYALWRARWELKVVVLFGILLLVAALLEPMADPPKWQALLTAWGVRYWFMPMLAFVSALVWMAGTEHPKAVRLVATAALVLMSVGIVREWRHPRFADLHFAEYARQYSELPKGSSLTVPINPPGWSMTLVKK